MESTSVKVVKLEGDVARPTRGTTFTVKLSLSRLQILMVKYRYVLSFTIAPCHFFNIFLELFCPLFSMNSLMSCPCILFCLSLHHFDWTFESFDCAALWL